MKKFLALLKVSVKAMLLTSSGVGMGKRRRAVSGVGAVVLIAFLGLYLSGMYSFMLVDVLAPVGMESLVLVFMGLTALFGGLLFTVFAVRGVLFGGKDNDLMLSLPVPASLLVASRMAAIYLENLVFSFFVLLPAGAACFFLGSQDYGAGLWIRVVLAALALPLLDTALSVLLGAGLAFLSSKVSKGKALGQNVVMALFLVAVFYFSFRLNDLIAELAVHAAGIKEGMTWAAPLLWMADGVLGDWGLLLAFLACCAIPFALVALVLGKGYRRAVTAFQTRTARSDYRLTAQSAAGQRKALLRKEAKRFFGTPIYFWNGGLGLIFLLVLGGAAEVREALWQGLDQTTAARRRVNTAAANEGQRRDLIAAYGWEVAEEPLEIREVVIPSSFDETYEKYNTIQKQQGFDLSRYRGRSCRRYVYEVLNYPGGVEDARLTLLIYQDRLIGGDVSSTSADGFMHGLDPTATVWLG